MFVEGDNGLFLDDDDSLWIPLRMETTSSWKRSFKHFSLT